MKQIVIAVVFLLCLVMSSCGEKEENKEFISPFLEDIGKTQSEVFKKYGMSTEDTHGKQGVDEGLYYYPEELDYLGNPNFFAVFYFDITIPEPTLYGYTYYRLFEEDSEDILPVAKEIFQKLSSTNDQQKGVDGYGEDSIFSVLDAESPDDLDRENYKDIWVSKDHQILIEYHLDKLRNQDQTMWVLWVQYRINVWNNY